MLLRSTLGPPQQNENLFSVKEPVIIRTLPQYYNNKLHYNELLKNINFRKSRQNDHLIEPGKEYRFLCTNIPRQTGIGVFEKAIIIPSTVQRQLMSPFFFGGEVRHCLSEWRNTAEMQVR